MTTDLGGRVEAGVAAAAQVEVGAGPRHQGVGPAANLEEMRRAVSRLGLGQEHRLD